MSEADRRIDAWSSQDGFAVRFGWGMRGLDALGTSSDVVIVVDVLSFTTCVEIATTRGCAILPYTWYDGGETAYATSHDAVVAPRHGRPQALAAPGRPIPTLSPRSMLDCTPGTRVVLPSPNGSAVAHSAAALGCVVLAACLRNATAAGAVPRRVGTTVSVIAAGERWDATGALRPCVEDLAGAGAVIDAIDGSRSPEATAAAGAFGVMAPDLDRHVRESTSGRELAAAGRDADVALAAELDVSTTVPALDGAVFVPYRDRGAPAR